MSIKTPIVLIDDEPAFTKGLSYLLNKETFKEIQVFEDALDAYEGLPDDFRGVLFVDMLMPKMDGMTFIEKFKEKSPQSVIVMITAINETPKVVEAINLGAFDYLVKPIDVDHLFMCLNRCLAVVELQEKQKELQSALFEGKLEFPEAFDKIKTRSKRMLQCFHYMEQIRLSESSVTILGETGVGKELFVEALSQLSTPNEPLVKENVASLDLQLFSATLFGYKKGAFTGADRDFPGLIEEAKGGVLFLDEIGDLSLDIQVKLLRLLQEREYRSLGDLVLKPLQCRIIFATQCDLEAMVERGEFRRDLWYRINTHLIKIPPLRERLEDIDVILESHLQKLGEKIGVEFHPKFELKEVLKEYHWPGNVREFESVISDACFHHQGGEIPISLIKEKLGITFQSEQPRENVSHKPTHFQETTSPGELDLNLVNNEKKLIQVALSHCEGNQSQAAKLLGLKRDTLNKKLKRLGL